MIRSKAAVHPNTYRGPMQSWPGLKAFARHIYLPKGDLSLHLYDAGRADAALLLLVHGLGDEADTWRHLIPSLASRYRVLAPDLPGFGRSDQPKRSYTLPFYLETLLELLDELGGARVTLVGHSLGAMIAQSMALAYTDRAERLILIGGSLVSRPRQLDLGTVLFFIPGIGEWLYNRLRKDPQAAYETLRPYYGDLDRLPEADRAFLFQRVNERVWSDGQRRAFFSTYRHLALSLPVLQREVPGRLAKLSTPTLVVWGELDRINPVENNRTLFDLQPSARLVVVPEAGHNVHQGQPQAVLAAIQDR